MRTMAVGAALVAVASAAAMGTVLAAAAEDDLAVVKRAVSVQVPARVAEQDALERRSEAPAAAVSSRELRWFKVRITEKGAKKARVNVNLPIALVRALGDDFPIDIGRHHHGRDGWRSSRQEPVIRLGDVLAALEAGQSLVEIEDDEATVRVWVE